MGRRARPAPRMPFRSVNRRQPSNAALIAAAASVVLSLATLVVLPLVMTRQLERYRIAQEQHAEPARAALHEVNYRLSQQIALLTRAIARQDMQLIVAYRSAIVPQERAMERLGEHTGFLGRGFDSAYAELRARIAAWHSSVQRSVDTEQLAFDTNYPAAIEAIHRLDEEITAFQSRSRNQVRRLTRLQFRLTALLVVLALIAAAIVLWIILRLRSVATELSHLVRVRDEILGIVSHDLRSPLTTITLSTQLIPGSPPDEQKEHVETIVSTTRRMERLIQDLLDATRIEAGNLSIKRDLFDPATVTREVVASHEPIAASKKIRFEAAIGDSLPAVCGDSDRLAQALSNLIGNAFKFTPEGGTVRLSVTRLDGRVRFEVADTGPGIAPSDFPHLFEPFWQAKKTAHMGAGLGLKITRAIVDAHGGRIDVRNLPQGGACFRLEIPAEK